MDFITNLLQQVSGFYIETASWLVLGFIIAGVLHLFFPESFILKHLGKSNTSSVVKSSLLGIPIPICSCGVIPVAASLRKKGASKGATLSFLISTPQIGTDSFMITYSLIGWVFGIFRIVAAFITAFLAGIFANIFGGEDKPKEKAKTQKHSHDSSFMERMHTLISFIQNELFGSIANSLVIGLILAGAISALVPESFFQEYMSNQFVSMLIMLVISVPLYICATSSTPIAASLILKGMAPGAALVLLLAGPATNAVTISTVAKTLGKRVVAIYLGTISLVSVALGYLLNYLVDVENIKIIQHHAHGKETSIISIIGVVILSVMLIVHYSKFFYLKFIKKQHKNSEQKISLNNLTCAHCAAGVKKAVEGVEGTSEVMVDLSSQTVSFNYKGGDINIVKKSIEDSGFDIKEDK